MGLVEPSSNLRDSLREATAQAHDQLDSTMRAVAGWSSQADYARFLSLQHTARAPIEAWLADNAPSDLVPPEQTPLIATDLEALGHTAPLAKIAFVPQGASRIGSATGGQVDHLTQRCEALGIAWVLAGSSLGNRAILAEIRRTAKARGWQDWPAKFLGNEAMLAFWKRLRSELENSAEMEVVEVASRAATSVFDHFLAHAQASPGSNTISAANGIPGHSTEQGAMP